MSGLKDLAGRVGVVTGGASGIGRGIAEVLISNGVTVVIADIETAVLEKTAAEIGAVGIVTDVTDYQSVEALARTVVERFGKVDIVCNNAGIGPMARMEDMSIDDWKWMIDVNLWGVVNGVQAFLPHLIANPAGGHIVNTASQGGLMTVPTLGAYCATKFAVVGLTESLSAELAADHPTIGATIFCPGTIRSNLGKSRRNRPSNLDAGALTDVLLEEMDKFEGGIPWKDPVDAGNAVVEAIKNGSLYALTHPDQFALLLPRMQVIAGAHGMELQAS